MGTKRTYRDANLVKAFYGWMALGNGNISCRIMKSKGFDFYYVSNGISTVRVLPNMNIKIETHDLTSRQTAFICNPFINASSDEETEMIPYKLYKGYEILKGCFEIEDQIFNNNNYKATIRLLKVLYNTQHIQTTYNSRLKCLFLFINGTYTRRAVIQSGGGV